MSLSFPLDHRHDLGPDERAAVLGWLGADLNDLAVHAGLPVPAGFTLTTEAAAVVARDGWTDDVEKALLDGISAIEAATGRALGSPTAPLLVSVRPGGPVPLPGLAPPVLDLGIDAGARDGLIALGGERFAADTELLFVERYTTSVLDGRETPFEELRASARAFAGVEFDEALPDGLVRLAVDRARELAVASGGIPEAPIDQLRAAVRHAIDAWQRPAAVALRNRRGIPHEPGHAVTVQAMVYGNIGPRSGSGLLWSHDPATGDPGLSGVMRRRSQGSGELPGAHEEIPLAEASVANPDGVETVAGWLDTLSGADRDVVGLDVTVERGEPWVLRSRRGAPTGAAALRSTVAAVEAGELDRRVALTRLRAEQLEDVLHGSIDTGDASVLTTGLGASPGAATGVIVLSADEAAVRAAEGESVILVKQETSPEDINGMSAAAGILTTRGGLASHAAVVARGWGTPAVCGAEDIELLDDGIRIGATTLAAGDQISIDGSSGAVLVGEVTVSESSGSDDLEIVLAWADEVRAGRLAVRANADTGPDAARARSFGAEGIGLCRTEHMFLGDDRLPIMREMILAADEAAEARALRKLRRAQKADFIDLLEAMDGLPVTVRLLDPPLHEFLPEVTDLEIKEATEGLDADEQAMLDAARSWSEVNPMIGTRGVRLAYLKPGLYEMQVKALVDAAIARRQAGGEPVVEVMIPLTTTGPELAGARRWVVEAVAEKGEAAADLDIVIGTMIETPRAALRAADLAEHADFFSFGTNDLTQLTFGFSRDDVEARVMGRYLDEGLLAGNPFESVDDGGVGRLVRLAAEEGRVARPGIKLGVCGEHGGDPASIRVFHEAGLDYVSCSPFRVPIARLAAAQAILAADQSAT
ncbi:MAG: putative PEP-binding protein [Actinomycetota bacterium]